MPGYIEDRGNGSYRLVVSNGYDDTGHRKKMTRTVKAKSKKEAEKLLALFVAEIEKEEYLGPTKETFKSFAEKWLKDYAELHVEFKTIDRYKDMLNHAIYPEIGHLPLEKIKPPHLTTLYRKLSEDGARRDGKKGGYSSATIRHHHNLIHVILDRAVKWNLIATNPAERVDSPKRKTEHPATYYDEEQSARLLSCLKDEPIKYQLALTIGITTALRRGEVIGLRWTDIDLENCVISVSQSYEHRRKEGGSPKSTKTPNSQQKVAFPPSLASLFKEYKVARRAKRAVR